jgi:diaminopimelate epimerase
MEFAKAHALGNDFLVIDRREGDEYSKIGDFARRVCDRHTGIGADGLLLIFIKDKAKGLVDFRIFNADGSEAEVSGNGLRCATAFLFHQKKVDPEKIHFSTPAGDLECKLIEQKNNLFQIRLDMGKPRLASREIPFDDGVFHEKIIDYPLIINRRIYPITVVSMGNPHCSVFVESFPARIEWHQTGSEIESHPFFPNRTNVEFIRVLSRDEIEVLFWERGVGETLSSGSGSGAAAVASILKNLTDKRVKVRTSMGTVTVEWQNEKIYQSGPAEVIFEGQYFPDIG